MASTQAPHTAASATRRHAAQRCGASASTTVRARLRHIPDDDARRGVAMLRTVGGALELAARGRNLMRGHEFQRIAGYHTGSRERARGQLEHTLGATHDTRETPGPQRAVHAH